MKDLEYSFLLQHEDTGVIVEKIFSYPEVFSGVAAHTMAAMGRYYIIAKRSWTGKEDYNGKKIYEGDILRWVSWEQEGTENPDIYIVKWKAPSFIWECFRGNHSLDTNGELLRDTNEFEVVGNIYEDRQKLPVDMVI